MTVRHSFQVVRMWEQPPEALLQSRALLPLAVLCQTDNATGLLSQVAAEVAKIEQPEEREEIIGSTQLLAGLRLDLNVVRSMFQGGFMRESVVFQEILEEGRIEGREEGAIAFTAKWRSPLRTTVAIVKPRRAISHISC